MIAEHTMETCACVTCLLRREYRRGVEDGIRARKTAERQVIGLQVRYAHGVAILPEPAHCRTARRRKRGWVMQEVLLAAYAAGWFAVASTVYLNMSDDGAKWTAVDTLQLLALGMAWPVLVPIGLIGRWSGKL